MITAGVSDKYGQVAVERTGNTGFDDPSEPVALFRAQDRHAEAVLRDYCDRLLSDPDVPDEQVLSVERQLDAFRTWRDAHPEKVRTPGRPG